MVIVVRMIVIEDGEALGLSSVEIRHLSLVSRLLGGSDPQGIRKEVELVVVVVGKGQVLRVLVVQVEVGKYCDLGMALVV